MSEIFHALLAGERFTCPTSRYATIWAMSVDRCARNFLHALDCDTTLLPSTRAVTLPAQHIHMDQVANEIAKQCGTNADLVEWQPDSELETAFGAYPPLKTAAAERAGFADDGSVARLVQSALQTLR